MSMISLANCESVANNARRFSSTSPRTYSAKTILQPLWRQRISTPREALQGENNPSRTIPESQNSLETGVELLLSIQTREPLLTHLVQVFQRPFKRNAAFCQRLLQTSAKTVQLCLSRRHMDLYLSSRFLLLFTYFDCCCGSERFHWRSPFASCYGAEKSTACQGN